MLRQRRDGTHAGQGLLCVLALLLAACGAATPMPTPTQTLGVSETPRVLAATPAAVHTQLLAELRGRLVLVDGCLRVQSSDPPGDSLLLVFTPDITASVNGDAVLLADHFQNTHTTWRLGDTVGAFGGYISSPTPSPLPVPANCPGPYFVFSGWYADASPTPAAATQTLGVSETPRVLTATPAPTWTPTPAPNVTEITQGGLVTFTDTALGLTFNYQPVQLGANVRTRVDTDRVYVFYDDNTPDDPGQYVQVLRKAPGDTLTQAIQKQIMSGYDPQDCVVQSFQSAEPHPPTQTYAAISPRVPPTANANQDGFATELAQAKKCPPVYTVAGGEVYFMADSAYPDRFFFFKIGQYTIYGTGPGPYGDPWQNTLQVIDARP